MTSKKTFAADLLITIPFLIYCLIQIAHHDLWRDELNVYGIAHASPTFQSLMWHVNHEGHPLIWYLIIWLGIKLIPSILILKIVQAIVGCAIILLVGFARPFTWVERVLLLCSYFVLFEYTVLSRMYGICIVLVMLFLWRRVYRPDSFWPNSIILALMANTDTLGLFFSGAFGLEWILSRYRQVSDKQAFFKRAAPAALIYVSGVLLCYLTVRPPSDISDIGWRATGQPPSHATPLAHAGSVLVEYLELPWVPIRFAGPHPLFGSQYWNPFAIDHKILYSVLFPLILLAYFITFRRDRDLLAAFLLTSLGGAAFAVVVYSGHMRNWGITFVAYVAALWLQRFRRPERPWVSTILLTACAVFGVIFSGLMWTKPFSSAEATARWLQTHGLQNAALVGNPDTSASVIAILMKRPMYYLECRCSDDYMLFSNRRDGFNPNDLAKDTIEAFDRLHTAHLVLVLTGPLDARDQSGLEQGGATVDCLAAFTKGEAPDENFWIYSVDRRSTG